jgi:hypothetical protein
LLSGRLPGRSAANARHRSLSLPSVENVDGIFADHIDVHLAVDKLRRRYGWAVDAEEGRPGYHLEAWPFSFPQRRRRRTLL